MSEVQQLQKCARCHCNILLETYFSKNRKGKYNKTCDRCRIRFKCSTCEYTCSSNCDLQKHIKFVHTKIKDVRCEQCNYTCSNNSDLKKHIKAVHDKIKDFECPTCDFKCSYNVELQRHIKQVHDKIKDVRCPTCEYKCFGKSHLQAHIKVVHNKIKDFHCHTCDYTCSTNGDLQRHIKQVHDKIKDIQCPTCDYKCFCKSNMSEHIKQVHDKIKDFHCSTCDYKCCKKGDLQRHIKICVGDEVGSSGEVKIKKVLNEMKIDYEYNTTHEVRSEKALLRWDFVINGDEPLFIEYDGKQHFEPVKFGGISQEKASEAFRKQKKYDKLKDDYCNDNGYLLLRIPYTEYENIEKLVVEFIRDNTNWGCE